MMHLQSRVALLPAGHPPGRDPLTPTPPGCWDNGVVDGECLHLDVLTPSLRHLGHGMRDFACPKVFQFSWDIQKQDQQ